MAAITGAVLSGLALGLQVHGMEEAKAGQREQRRQEEKANNIQQAQTSMDRARARRRAVAQSRLAQAQNEALATQQGVGLDSSQIAGAQASLSSNLGSSIAADNRALTSGMQTFNARQAGVNALNSGLNSQATFNAAAGALNLGGSMYDQYRSPSTKDNKPVGWGVRTSDTPWYGL